jgi:hypothetical protein
VSYRSPGRIEPDHSPSLPIGAEAVDESAARAVADRAVQSRFPSGTRLPGISRIDRETSAQFLKER